MLDFRVPNKTFTIKTCSDEATVVERMLVLGKTLNNSYLLSLEHIIWAKKKNNSQIISQQNNNYQ